MMATEPVIQYNRCIAKFFIFPEEVSMMKIEKSVLINKPVEEVFAVVTDGSKASTWQGGLEAVEGVTDTVGAQFTEVRKFLGREMRSVLEVTAFEPCSKWAARIVKGPVPYEVTVRLDPQEGGTRLTTSVEGEPTGFFKMAEGMFTSQLEKSIEQDTDRLKRLMEEG
jgi:uncharacterized protein YndB with AHSA1/START domain